MLRIYDHVESTYEFLEWGGGGTKNKTNINKKKKPYINDHR